MEYLSINPSERLFQIHSEVESGDTLTIQKTDWLAASKQLRGVAFKLYMYLASHKDNSPCVLAADNTASQLGFSSPSFWKALSELQGGGYLVPIDGKRFDFYTAPSSGHTQGGKEHV
ncbi:hypothetical protein LJC60_04385 [Ruminococcaceae bacterium OttesenSCG-928-D13]|nr:hypothetical protein [Ruminococcaceae bacterium OttesenSCG-928-D13]